MSISVKDVIGMRFSRLTVYRREPNALRNKVMLACVCDCGTEKVVAKRHLTSSHTRSCGCLAAEISAKRLTTHGGTANKRIGSIYQAWNSMKDRCLNPKAKAFKHYGGRGITICDEWINSFEAFRRDMGERPSTSHSLDRIDNDKGYSPSNCRWATPKLQSRNRRGTQINEEIATLIRQERAAGIKSCDTIASFKISKSIYKQVVLGITWQPDHVG